MQTFLDYYEQEIQPQIAAIDIFLKSEEPPYDSDIVGELLEIPPSEWQQLLQEEQITFITRRIFFQLMKRGNSPLCGMFRRATELYLPEAYTAEVIAYIFCLPIEPVRKAAEELGQKTFTDEMLPQMFSKISLSETRFPF
ncbi:MAG: hypothetical protein J6L66_07610 [Anaerotignum sp.]|nr:hypothetical protein [Anaerotignum sp.]